MRESTDETLRNPDIDKQKRARSRSRWLALAPVVVALVATTAIMLYAIASAPNTPRAPSGEPEGTISATAAEHRAHGVTDRIAHRGAFSHCKGRADVDERTRGADAKPAGVAAHDARASRTSIFGVSLRAWSSFLGLVLVWYAIGVALMPWVAPAASHENAG